MSTSMTRLLGATTALVALAGASHAQTYDSTTAITGAINPVSASALVTISGSQVVSVSAAPAITVSGSGAGVVSVTGTNGVVRSNDTVGTILAASGSTLDSLEVNNAGTISNLSENGFAIQAMMKANDGLGISLSVVNTGTISGSIRTTTGTLTYVGTGSSSVLNGNIASGNTEGNDRVEVLTGARIVGNIGLASGTNIVTVSGSNASVTGNITGGLGADTLTIGNGATVTGNVDLGGSNNTVTINDSSLIANSGAALTFGNGTDIVTVSNSTVSGSMVFGTGTDTLQAYGTFATGGTISGLENLNVSGTSTVNHAITGLAAVGVGAGSTLNVNEDMTLSGALTNAGTIQIAADKTLSADTSADGGKFILDLVDNTSIGRISTTGAGPTLTNTSFTINTAGQQGFIASGTTYTIMENAGANTAVGALTTSNSGVYTFFLDDSGNNVVLRVHRTSTSSLVQGGTNQAIANVLDTLANTPVSTSALYAMQGAIGAQTSAQGVQNVIESFNHNMDGIAAAGIGVATATGNQVSNRLASLRSGSALSGVATGSASSRHMWVEGFGNMVEQDDKNGQRGYDANSAGMTFGFDTEEAVAGYTTGASFSYGNGSVDSNAYGGATADIDSYVGTLYGSRVMDDGMFINAQANLGMNNYESSRVVAGVGTATADFDGWQAGLKGEVGRDYDMGGTTITPMAGLQYTYLNIDEYTETGAGAGNLTVDPESMNALDASLGAQAAFTMPMENGGSLKPSVHAKYVYRMGDTSFDTTSRFTGGGAAFSTSGVKADRSSVNLGAGLLLTTAGGVDLSLNYDADIRDSLTGHSGQLKARWAF